MSRFLLTILRPRSLTIASRILIKLRAPRDQTRSPCQGSFGTSIVVQRAHRLKVPAHATLTIVRVIGAMSGIGATVSSIGLGNTGSDFVIAYRPPKGNFGREKTSSGLRNAPFGKVAMETTPAKQDAAIKCCPEKRLTASRTFPVCQPRGNEKVGDKS